VVAGVVAARHHCGMARLSIFVFLAQLVLAVLALISCLSAEDEKIRALPRLVWVLVILLLPIIGPGAWFLAGRPRAATAGDGRPRGGLPDSGRAKPVAPDDNAEFLRSLDQGRDERAKDRELFAKWEEDLKRREDDLRRQNEDPRTES